MMNKFKCIINCWKWKNFKHWIDVLASILLEFFYLRHYLPQTNFYEKLAEKKITEEIWHTLVPVSQNILIGSVIAISILLPSTIGLMYYLLQNKDIKQQIVKDAITSFYLASLIFLISLLLAVVVMGFMPMRLELKVNPTKDWVLLTWATMHFTAFALGVFKLFRGGFYIRKIFHYSSVKRQTNFE